MSLLLIVFHYATPKIFSQGKQLDKTLAMNYLYAR